MRTRPRRNSNTPDQEAARIFEAKLRHHVKENPECQWEFDWYRNTLKKSIRRSRVLIDEQVKKKAESDQPLCNKFMLELAKPHSYLDEAGMSSPGLLSPMSDRSGFLSPMAESGFRSPLSDDSSPERVSERARSPASDSSTSPERNQSIHFGADPVAFPTTVPGGFNPVAGSVETSPRLRTAIPNTPYDESATSSVAPTPKVPGAFLASLTSLIPSVKNSPAMRSDVIPSVPSPEAVPTSEPSRPVESISKSSVPEIIFMPDMDTATPRFERPSPFDHVRTDADATRGDATQIAGRTDSTRKVDDKAREIPRTNYTTRDIPRTTTPHTSYQAGDHPIVLDSVEIGSLRGDAGDLSPSIGERNAPVQVERAQESKPVPVFQIPPTPKGPYKLPGTFQESLTSVDDLTVHIPSKQTEDEARTPTGERESPDLVSPRDDEVLVPGPVAARETTPAPVSRGPYKLPGTYHASVQSLATLDGSGEDLTVQIPKEPEVASADEAQTPTEPVAGKEKEQPTIEPEVVPKQVEQEAPSGGLGLQGVSTEPKSQVIPAESKPPVGFVEPESSALPSQPELPVASSELEPAAVLGEPEAALPVDNSTTQPVVEELPKDAPAEPAQPVSATAPASASTSRGPYKLPGAFQTSVQSLVTHDGSGEDLTTQVSKKPEVVVEDAAESTEPAAEEKQPIVSSQPEPKAASSDLPKPQVASSEPEEQFESSEPKTEPTSEPEPSSLPVAPTIDDSTAQVSIEPTTEKQKDVELEQPVAPSQAEPEVGPNEPESQAESSQPDREVEPSQPAPMAESSVLVPATAPGVSVDDSPAQVSKDRSKAQAKPAASAEPIDQAVSDEPKTVPGASSEPVQDLDDSLLLDSVLDLDQFPKPPPTLHVPVTQPSLDSQKSPISPIVPGAYPRNIFGITPVLSTKPLEGASPNPVSEPLPPAPPSDELDQNVSAPAPAPAGRVPLPTGPLELNTSQDVLKPVLESGTPSFKYLSGLTPYDIRSRGVNDEREDDVEELADVEPVSEPVLAVPGLEAVLESKEEAPEPVEAVDEPEALSHGVETIPEPVVAKEPVEDAPEPAENVPEPVGPVDEPVEAVPKSAELVPEAVEATPQPVETAHEPVLEPEALDEPSVDAPKPSEAQDEASSLSESENVPAVAEETREPTEEVKSNSEVATGPVEVATELAEVAPEPTVATPEPLGRVEEPVKAVPGSVEAISGGVEATPGRAEVVPEPEAKPEIQDERSNVDAAPQPDEPSRDVVDLPSKTLSTLAAAEKTEEPIEDNGPPENVPPPAVTEPDTVVPPVTAEPAKASESAREEEPVKTSTETPAVQVDSTPGTNAPSKIEEVKDLQTHDKPNSAVTEPQAELPPATAQESTPATPVSQPQHVDEPQREAEAPQVKLEATPTQEPVIQPEEHLQTQPKDEPVVPSLDPTPAVQQSVEAQPEADHDSKAEPAVPPVETTETQAPVISQADPIVAKESEPAPTESKTEPLPAAETLATIKPVRHADEPRGETETPQVELETAPNQQLANQTKEMHPQTLPKDEPVVPSSDPAPAVQQAVEPQPEGHDFEANPVVVPLAEKTKSQSEEPAPAAAQVEPVTAKEPEQASAESKAEPLSTLEPSPAAELEEPQLGQTSTSGNLAIPPSAPVVAAAATPSPQVPQTIPSANIAPASKPRFVVAPVAPVVEPSLVPQGLPPPLEPSSEVADESKPAAVAPSEPIPRISNSTPLPEPNPDVKLDVPESTEPAKLKAVINSLGDDIPEIIDNGPEEAPIAQPAANVHAPKGVEAAPESIKEVEEARLDEVSEQTESKDEPRSPSFEPVVVAPVVQQLVETRSKLAHDTKAEQALAIPQAETVVLESEPEPVKEVEQAAPEPKIAPPPVVELDQSEPEPSQAPTLDNLPALSVATPVSQVSERDPSANTTPIPESQSTTSEVAQAIPETQALPAPVIESLSHVVKEAKPVVVEHSGTLPAILDSAQLSEPEPDVKLAAPTEEPAEPGASVEHVLPKVESIVDIDQEATSDVQPAAEGVRIHAPKTVESLPQTKAEQTQPELVLETPQPTTQSAPEPETATPKDIREEKAVNTRITEPQLVAGPTSKPSSQAPEIPQIPGKPVAISIAQLSGPSAPATPEAPVQQIQVQPHLNTPAKSAEVLPVAQPKDRPVPSAERDVIPGQPVDSQLPRETEVDQPEAPEHRPSSELLQLTPKAANLHETDPKPDAVLDVPNPVPIKASIVNPPASQTADVVQETLHRPEPAEIVQPVPETKSQPPPQVQTSQPSLEPSKASISSAALSMPPAMFLPGPGPSPTPHPAQATPAASTTFDTVPKASAVPVLQKADVEQEPTKPVVEELSYVPDSVSGTTQDVAAVEDETPTAKPSPKPVEPEAEVEAPGERALLKPSLDLSDRRAMSPVSAAESPLATPLDGLAPAPQMRSQSPTPPDEPESRLDPKVNDLRKEADKFAQQFSAYGDIDDLDNAIQKYGEAAELLAPDSETLDVSSYLNLGRMMRVKFEAFYDIEDLKSAVNDALLKAHASLEAKPTDPTYYDVLHELGAAFLDRYLYYGFETAEDKADFEDSGDEADLETAGNKAEEYCQLALNASSTPSGSKVAATHIVLSRIHLTRFEYLSTAGDAIEALRSLGRAADADRNLANDARYQEYRARALYACYQTGQPEYGGYLDQAFNFAVRARNQTPNTTVQFPIVSTFLAELLLARYERSNNRADLDEALRLLEDAVQEVPYICPEQPWIGECLARGLVARYVNDGDRDDLEDAISFLDIAVNLTVKNTYRRRARLNTLGGALTLRFRHLALGDGSGRARELMAGIGSM